MQVIVADGSTQELPLYDYGTGVGDGVPVVWTPGVGVTQDPAYGSVAYSPNDVLTDDNGHWYQIHADWSIHLYSAASTGTAPTTRKGVDTSTGALPKAPAKTVVDPNVNAAQSTTNTLGAFFDQKLKLGTGFNVPYWMLFAGGAAVLSLRKRRR